MSWNILENLWKRTVDPSSFSNENNIESWDNEIKTLYQLGISMEDTLQFLYFENPDFENFKSWVNNRKRETDFETEDLIDNVLTKEDLNFGIKMVM